MENNRLKQIRESERKSHIEMYSNDELYKEGSWLRRHIKTVLDIIPLFDEYEDFTEDAWITINDSVMAQLGRAW